MILNRSANFAGTLLLLEATFKQRLFVYYFSIQIESNMERKKCLHKIWKGSIFNAKPIVMKIKNFH